MDLVGIDHAVEPEDLHRDAVTVAAQYQMVAAQRFFIDNDLLRRLTADGNGLTLA